MAKNNKTNTNNAAAARADFADRAAVSQAKCNDMLATKRAEIETKGTKERAEFLSAKNDAEQAVLFMQSLDNTAFSEAFTRFELDAPKVMALPVYARDKVHNILRAVASNCALSAISTRAHANMSTQALVLAMVKEGSLTTKAAPDAMRAAYPHKAAGTYPTQATTSRQALALLGLLNFDALTRAFSLNEKGEEIVNILKA